MAAGLGLGLLLPHFTTDASVASTRVTESLVAVGFGTLGLVSIIFSLLFLVVQWAFGSLSPRLNLFRDDPIVWRTFGVAVGVFVYSVTAALVVGGRTQVSVIVPAVEVAAVLVTLALMRVLQVKASTTSTAVPARRSRVLPLCCRHCAAPSPGRTGRPPCSRSTCPACSKRPAAPSSCSGPASATLSSRVPRSPICTVAR